MTITREFESQCTHAVFMANLPKALGNRPYEVVENEVVVFDGPRQVKITVSEQPIRELGSLDLPMEAATFEFEDFSEDEVEKFMSDYKLHTLRCGGG